MYLLVLFPIISSIETAPNPGGIVAYKPEVDDYFTSETFEINDKEGFELLYTNFKNE
jgi:hypothetical protein